MLDQFFHTLSGLCLSNDIGGDFQLGDRVRQSNAASASIQKREIVFRVADAHHPFRGKSDLRERRSQACSFIDSQRQAPLLRPCCKSPAGHSRFRRLLEE